MDDFYFSIPSFSLCLGDLKPLMLKVISEQCILIEVIMLLVFFSVYDSNVILCFQEL